MDKVEVVPSPPLFRIALSEPKPFVKRIQGMHATPLVWEQHATQQTHICEPAESPRAGPLLG